MKKTSFFVDSVYLPVQKQIKFVVKKMISLKIEWTRNLTLEGAKNFDQNYT